MTSETLEAKRLAPVREFAKSPDELRQIVLSSVNHGRAVHIDELAASVAPELTDKMRDCIWRLIENGELQVSWDRYLTLAE